MVRIALLCAVLALAGCSATGGRYTGDTFYGPAGSGWSCRKEGEPAKAGTPLQAGDYLNKAKLPVRPGDAYAGGNCRPNAEWARPY